LKLVARALKTPLYRRQLGLRSGAIYLFDLALFDLEFSILLLFDVDAFDQHLRGFVWSGSRGGGYALGVGLRAW
jgi:hypothetical protein